jgi:cysteine desulfurase
MTVYLDNAATTAVCPEAAQAALEIMTVNYGNPSSTHTMGEMPTKR